MTSHERGRAPWWASGVDDLRDDVDPFDAHRRARRHEDPAGSPDAAGDRPGGSSRSEGVDGWGRDDADAWSHPGRGGRPGLEDVVEAIGALARAATRRASGGPRGGEAGTRRGPVHDPACRSCPVCMLTRSLGDARPEVVEHLELAARHLVLAARAVVDAAEERTGWERIELDEDGPGGDGPGGGSWDDAGRHSS